MLNFLDFDINLNFEDVLLNFLDFVSARKRKNIYENPLDRCFFIPNINNKIAESYQMHIIIIIQVASYK